MPKKNSIVALKKDMMSQMRKGGMKHVQAKKLGGDVLGKVGETLGNYLQGMLGFRRGGRRSKM